MNILKLLILSLPSILLLQPQARAADLDLLTPMLAWVEDGQPPDAVLTASSAETSTFGQPDGGASGGHHPAAQDLGVAPLPAMTRPAYPYPHVALWSGQGDVYDAANWGKGPAAEIVTTRDWPGADLFAPYAFAR